jgi:hypothetical protein
LHHQTGERTGNLYLPKVRLTKTEQKNQITAAKYNDVILAKYKPDLIKMHPILTYKQENERIGCINRDRNSVFNMRTIVRQFLSTGERPARFTRAVVIPPYVSPILKKPKLYTKPFLNKISLRKRKIGIIRPIEVQL